MSDDQQQPRSYETAAARIEEIIKRLDSGEAGLRETLDLVREGRELVDYCATELEAVGQGLEELKLDELVQRLESRQPALRLAAGVLARLLQLLLDRLALVVRERQPLLQQRHRLGGAPGLAQRLRQVEQRVRVVELGRIVREGVDRPLEHGHRAGRVAALEQGVAAVVELGRRLRARRRVVDGVVSVGVVSGGAVEGVVAGASLVSVRSGRAAEVSVTSAPPPPPSSPPPPANTNTAAARTTTAAAAKRDRHQPARAAAVRGGGGAARRGVTTVGSRDHRGRRGHAGDGAVQLGGQVAGAPGPVLRAAPPSPSAAPRPPPRAPRASSRARRAAGRSVMLWAIWTGVSPVCARSPLNAS